MRRIFIIAVVVCLALVSMVATAQENPHQMKGDMPPMTIVMMYEETVHPAHMQAYEEGTRKWVAAIKEAGIDINFTTHQRMNEYGYMITFNDFSQMNGMAMKFSQAVNLLRDSEWGQARQKGIKHSKYTVWMMEPELSHWPEGQPQPGPHTPFIDVFYFTTSHVNEMNARAELKKWKEWDEVDEWSKGWMTWRNIIGEEGPMYIIVSFGERASSYMAHGEKMYQEHGEKMMEMRMNMGKYMTGMDQKYYYMRPDLALPMEMPMAEGPAEAK